MITFQHTAARRRLAPASRTAISRCTVSTHSRPKAAGSSCAHRHRRIQVSTHSRPKAAGIFLTHLKEKNHVSTHSRPKAAGARLIAQYCRDMFQHTAARRRLACRHRLQPDKDRVSTHSRPKAAGKQHIRDIELEEFQHTAARRRLALRPILNLPVNMFQHTAARRRLERLQADMAKLARCFNTQPPEGGWIINAYSAVLIHFVSTHSRPKAAGVVLNFPECSILVSTHSRPKAAGRSKPPSWHHSQRFNTQPPEGGWWFY